jgi:hypothetical protein
MVSQVQVSVAKVDDELKKLAVSYNEKVQSLSSAQRKKTTNLVTSDLEDFLTADVVQRHEFLDSDYLLTVLVVVPGQSEKGKVIGMHCSAAIADIDNVGRQCYCWLVLQHVFLCIISS